MHLCPIFRLNYCEIVLTGLMEMVLFIEKQTGAYCDLDVLKMLWNMGIGVMLGEVMNNVSMVNLGMNNSYVFLEKKQTLAWNGSTILKCNIFIFKGWTFEGVVNRTTLMKRLSENWRTPWLSYVGEALKQGASGTSDVAVINGWCWCGGSASLGQEMRKNVDTISASAVRKEGGGIPQERCKPLVAMGEFQSARGACHHLTLMGNCHIFHSNAMSCFRVDGFK